MQPKGFWSYARGDDDHLDKMLSDLRKRIAGEVSLLMGHDIGIFQDIHDLRTGDRWADKLRAELNAASFLIPVLTPRFFNRPWCREEVLTYLRLSQEAGLEPRIFPVRFVEWDDDPGCEVRAALQPFQYMDFLHWRFESDPTQKSRLEYAFAKDVKARLKLPPRPAAKAKPPEPPVREAQDAATMAKDEPLPKAPPAPQPKVHVVDPWPKRGDFTSIQAAINAADPGDRIVVREGTYRESLRLSKALEITGEGDVERIVVTTAKGNALRVDAPMARVSGLRLRREAGGREYGIWITGGAVELDDCVVESFSSALVGIYGGATNPTLRRCHLRDGAECGLLVYEGAQVQAEECRFSGNAFAGVEVKGETTRATLRRCRAEDGKGGGYFFHAGAGGLLDGCEASGNALSGVEIRTAADPLLRNCILRDNKQSGVLVLDSGRGQIDGGQVTGNGEAGVAVSDRGNPMVTGCTITANGYEAIWIIDATSTGTFRNNDLRGNGKGPWNIAEGASVIDEGNLT